MANYYSYNTNQVQADINMDNAIKDIQNQLLNIPTDTQLGLKANQSDLDTTNANVAANTTQLAKRVQYHKLLATEELNTVLSSSDYVVVEEGTFNVTQTITNVLNKTIVGIDRNKSILKLSDTAFFNLLNADNFNMKNLTIQVSLTNTNTILQVSVQNHLNNNSTSNMEIDVVINAPDPNNINNLFPVGQYTGLSVEAVGSNGLYGCKFKVDIMNPATGFKVISHTPSTNDGWITLNEFNLYVSNYSTMGVDLETANFFTNRFHLRLEDQATTTRTAIKFGANVVRNIIESVVLFYDGSSGLTAVYCDPTAQNNEITSGYIEGNITNYFQLTQNNKAQFTWVNGANASRTAGGTYVRNIAPVFNNIFNNGNFSDASLKNYTEANGATKLLVADTTADLGQLLRITNGANNSYLYLTTLLSLSAMLNNFVTVTVKCRTTSTNFRVAISKGGSTVGGEYHSGSGQWEIITCYSFIDSSATDFKPLLQLNDPINGKTADVAWVVVNIGSLTPNQYVPCILPSGVSGKFTLNSATTSVTITHGLSYTPYTVVCTPQGNVGNCWVTNITSTQFTFNCATAPGVNTTVSYMSK